jgi:hypothetical protein
MKTNLKNIIKRVLNEETTETSPLYWELPEKLVDELGLRLYKENDVVFLVEIHFDTRNVVFELTTTNQFGDLVPYDDSLEVPASYNGWYRRNLDDLSDEFKRFIFRRLDPKWFKYLF